MKFVFLKEEGTAGVDYIVDNYAQSGIYIYYTEETIGKKVKKVYTNVVLISKEMQTITWIAGAGTVGFDKFCDFLLSLKNDSTASKPTPAPPVNTTLQEMEFTGVDEKLFLKTIAILRGEKYKEVNE